MPMQFGPLDADRTRNTGKNINSSYGCTMKLNFICKITKHSCVPSRCFFFSAEEDDTYEVINEDNIYVCLKSSDLVNIRNQMELEGDQCQSVLLAEHVYDNSIVDPGMLLPLEEVPNYVNELQEQLDKYKREYEVRFFASVFS